MHYRESLFHTSLVLEVWDTFRSALEGLGTYDQVTHMNKAQTLKEKKKMHYNQHHPEVAKMVFKFKMKQALARLA